MTEFIAHFHPVLVHLPIGILLAALLLQWLSRKEKYANLRPALPVTLLAGAISAVASCFTGYLLSRTGEYDPSLVSWHMWLGISLALMSIILYVRSLASGPASKAPTIVLLALIMVTGHLGGSLTHGADYLTGPLRGTPGGNDEGGKETAAIANVQEALAYEDIIRPIFRSHCYSCHGPAKQKGGLRMDNPTALMAGGKDGIVIRAGKAEESDLMKRLLSGPEDEHHMPPKEKTPLNERQLDLIHWWIAQGADFSRKVKELQQPEKIRPALMALQNKSNLPPPSPDIPAEPVKPADQKVLALLRDSGVSVMPVALNSNYLMARVTSPVTDSRISLLSAIREQLVSLKLDNTIIGDNAIAHIARCGRLISLGLGNTRVTDKGLAQLGALHSLRVLNLCGTNITTAGVVSLRSLKQLRSLYLFGTHVNNRDWPLLHKTFPAALLDSGGYTLPMLAADTTVVKPVRVSP